VRTEARGREAHGRGGGHVELPLQAVRVRAVGVVRSALALPRASNRKALPPVKQSKADRIGNRATLPGDAAARLLAVQAQRAGGRVWHGGRVHRQALVETALVVELMLARCSMHAARCAMQHLMPTVHNWRRRTDSHCYKLSPPPAALWPHANHADGDCRKTNHLVAEGG
jgi:hypothetical protein